MSRLRDLCWRRTLGVIALALVLVSGCSPALLAFSHTPRDGCGCVGDCACVHGTMMDGTACARSVPSDTPTLKQCRPESDELAITSVDVNLVDAFEWLAPRLDATPTRTAREASLSSELSPETPPPRASI